MVEVIEYPKIAALEKVHAFFETHPYDIHIEEKIDGSNVAIRVDDELILQSRTTIINQEKPGMFKHFVEWAQANYKNWPVDRAATLYGEMIGNGKLKYNKDTPPFLLFDVRHDYGEKATWATYPGLESGAELYRVNRAPTLYYGPYQGIDHVKSFLEKSYYGDFDMEGVVIKALNVRCWYTRASDGEIIEYTEPLLCGKYVREDYKEMNAPKRSLTTVADPLQVIAESVVTSARIQKAKQRAEEEGKDYTRPHILIPYVLKDVHDENSDEIKDMLFSAYWKKLNGPIAKKVVELA